MRTHTTEHKPRTSAIQEERDSDEDDDDEDVNNNDESTLDEDNDGAEENDDNDEELDDEDGVSDAVTLLTQDDADVGGASSNALSTSYAANHPASQASPSNGHRRARKGKGLLQVLIDSKLDAIAQTRARCAELTRANREMLDSLQTTEKSTLGEVQTALLKYGKFTSSLSILQRGYEQERAAAVLARDARAQFHRDELQSLSDQLTRLEDRTQAMAEELHDVRVFKDHGQFTNAQVILVFDVVEAFLTPKQRLADVNARIAAARQLYDAEIADLEHVRLSSKTKREKDLDREIGRVRSGLSDVSALLHHHPTQLSIRRRSLC